MKKNNQNYTAEILLIGLAVLGIGLILTRVEIHLVLLNLFQSWLNSTHITVNRTLSSIDSYITSASLYDLVGYLLFFLALIFLLYRLRRRYLESVRWKGDICPRCGELILRVHRKPLDRIWGALNLRPLRRYHCTNQDCGWNGLRYGKPHAHPTEASTTRPFQAAQK